MRIDKLTSRLQEVLADAQSLAAGHDHNFIEPAHLIVALLEHQSGSSHPLKTEYCTSVTAINQIDRTKQLATYPFNKRLLGKQTAYRF